MPDQPDDSSHPVKGQARVHLAAATLTGLFIIFLVAMFLYFRDPSGAGQKIFENCVTTIPPIVPAM